MKEDIKDKFHKTIDVMNFANTGFRPFRKEMTALEDGLYSVIQCGYEGIYMSSCEWKNGQWKYHGADDIIAYSKPKIK